MSSRRRFLQKTSAFGAGSVLAPSFTYGIFNQNENDKLNIGLIGAGLRGTNHLNNLLLRKDVNIVAICDIDPNRINIAKNLISKAGQKTPKTFGINEHDYKNLLSGSEYGTHERVRGITPF